MILKDKIAVVTGVSKGIGESLCKQLLDKGSKVYGLGRNNFEAIHDNYSFIKTDLRNLKYVEQAFMQILNENGNSIDILSNGFKIRNAGNSTNDTGRPYIYMAFAENPFKNANAR